MEFIFALLTIGLGVVLLFGGYRLARLILPIWGFVAGFSVGGAVTGAMAGTPFLGTALGITVGLGLGLVCAVFAYLYYAVAVTILAASFGYWIGSSFMMLLGVNPGFWTALAGLALGVAFGIGAVLLNAPKYVLMAYTAITGAIVAVGGTMLLFGQTSLEAFSYASVHQAISHSGLWLLTTIIVAGIGIATQIATASAYDLETWDIGNHDHLPPTISPRGVH